jgi:hypothetical protein
VPFLTSRSKLCPRERLLLYFLDGISLWTKQYRCLWQRLRALVKDGRKSRDISALKCWVIRCYSVLSFNYTYILHSVIVRQIDEMQLKAPSFHHDFIVTRIYEFLINPGQDSFSDYGCPNFLTVVRCEWLCSNIRFCPTPFLSILNVLVCSS